MQTLSIDITWSREEGDAMRVLLGITHVFMEKIAWLL
jgi:hypothetical protein